MHLEECIWKNLEKWHNKTALVCAQTNCSYTYLQLYKKSNALTSFLCNLDKLKQSDRVAVALPNLPEYAIILLGVIQAGCTVTTLNPLYTSDEMSHQLIVAEAKVIFTTPETYKTVQIALQLSKLHIPIIVVRAKNDSTLPHGAIDFDEIARNHCDAKFDLRRSHDDTVLMLFSSGTTGLPKGVEITNRGLVSSLHQMSAPKLDPISETSESEQEVVPVVIPMFHIYGLVIVLLHGLLKGSKLVVVPKLSSKLFVNVLETYQPTVLYVVPPIFHMLLNRNNIKPSHFTNTKSIFSGAAPLGATDVMALSEKLQGKVNVFQLYGLSEVCLSHVQSSQVDGHRKPGGIGFLLPSTEAKIMSTTTGNEVGANQLGEMLLRGPQVMKGYYKDRNANDAAFTNDGWFKTGDLCYYDEDGHFFLTDRIKQLIKVSGYQVAAAELEELIRRHKDVDDVAVIGVPHEKFGEVPKAFVVRRRDSNVSSFAIQEFVKSKVVHYKQLIGGVSFVDSIPKSQAGKIQKIELKKY
ncbi:hypothetical protein PPYR_07063 [Photinus pyralis]|uniref:Uncharacterized protein n=2 Tax=Photinus pyralis TaxID=7054 RepID=A0A5N4API1_PHOPY|nr:hypothetical protein PPYR_07063 [Photinus pyralis]